MYTITLDTAKNFECTLKIQGASLNKSKVNLVIESNDMDIRCRGTITEKGKVSIPVKKLKGILEENSKGKMYLEVIAEDSYFTPYKTDYITEVSKKVNLKENVKITEVNQTVTADVTTNHPENIINILKENNVDIFNISHKSKSTQLIQSYIVKNNIKKEEYNKLMEQILSQLITVL
jgi:hypothetical protein